MLAVDQYSRYMTDLFDEKSVIGVSTLFQSFFGNPSHGSKTIYSPDAKVVEIDIMRGNERTAALIQRGSNSRNLGAKQKDTQTENFTTFSRAFPLIEEEGNINADQILNRVAGENPYSGKMKIDRMRGLALEHHLEHIRRITRLFEYLAGQSLLTGRMPGIIGTTNSDLIYDFRRNASNIITPAVPWNNAAADILGDLDSACDQLRIAGKVTPNFLLLAGDVANVFFADTKIQKMADVKGFSFISVGANNPVPSNLQGIVDGGGVARGYLFTPKGRQIWIFCYNDVYTDASGVAQNYMPDGSALLGFYGARCDRYFGPAELLPVT
ncbi:MAG: major capsid protein, partial [Spirochaetota bacterium]